MKTRYILLALTVVLWACNKEDIIPSGDSPAAQAYDDDDDNDSGGTTETEPSESRVAWSSDSCTVTLGEEDTYNFPTLSNPDKQEITYSSTLESVATIDSSGNVTVVGEGTTTISASAVANDSYLASTVSYTLIVEGNLQVAGLSWSASNHTATLASSDNVFPTLSNPNGLAVSYSSSSDDVATIDSEGNITLVAEGAVAIVATTEADDTYAAGSASYTLKVVKHEVSLSWSVSTCAQVLEEEDTGAYPTLTADPEGLSLSYSSSNTSVATIDASGNITLASTGSTTISATFAGDDTYKAASASYTLSVTSNTDEGAGSYTYPSSGDTSSDDDISRTTFTRMVTVTYASGGASVTGTTSDFDVTVSSNQVTITNNGTENVVYKLTGTASNGFFKLYSAKKQALHLSNLSLTNSTGAAINNQSGKRTFVYLEGTNTLADGSSAAYSTTGSEDMKGVLFSEGQIIFSGASGSSLTVTANNAQGKSGIVSDDYVRLMSGATVTVTSGSSAGHGVRGKEYVQLSDGTLKITTKAAKKKGISSEDYVLVEGGTTTITVSGGVAYDSDDGEYKGSAGIKADNYFGMTGGTLTITNTGAGGKGIRAGSDDYAGNGSAGVLTASYISGGTLTITTSGKESNDVSAKGVKIGWSVGSEDKVTANDGDFTLSGGTVIVSSSNSEGFEAKGTMKITGGSLHVTSSADDAVNCTEEMVISGGYVYANSSKNDALDSNGNMTITGGYVFAITTAGSPEVAIDCAERKTFTIGANATVVAYGGLESGYSASNTIYSLSGTANAWNALYNGSSFIAAFKAPSGLSSFAVTAPSLKSGYKGVSVSGTTYCNGVWATSGISGGSSVTLGSYSGGGNGGGRPGGGGGGWNH
ncbi:MAG: carbohydrate-binding domain-containing protein [Bacteroidales bacterium]|nr:carbohydrate-binding domain-containing protein [Bacteroidales bacterium]